MNLLLKKLSLSPFYFFGFCHFVLWSRSHFQFMHPVLILSYHRILPQKNINCSLSQSSMIFSLENFILQMKFLKKHFRIISFDEFFLIKDLQRKSTKPFAIVTFDDGWADNYLYAFEILYREGIPATIYLTSDYIGTDQMFWPERITEILLSTNIKQFKNFELKKWVLEYFTRSLYKMLLSINIENNKVRKKYIINVLILHLKEYSVNLINKLCEKISEKTDMHNERQDFERLLSWDEVRIMKDYNISFGSHTCSHAILPSLSPSEIINELVQSKLRIENMIGVPVADFSYPNGAYCTKVASAVQNAGYRSATTGINKLSNFTTSNYHLCRKGNNELRFIDHQGKLDNSFTMLEWSNFIGFFRGFKKNRYH